MNKPNKLSPKSELISADAIAGACAVTLTLASLMAFGQHMITSELEHSEVSLSERVALKKEIRRNQSIEIYVKPALVKQSLPKTERARDFSDTVKSEKYWKDLFVTVTKPKRVQSPKKNPQFPPVVIGSKD